MTLSKEKFDACDWQSVIQNSPKPLCEEYARLYGESAIVAQSTGNEEEREIFKLLYGVTSLRLDPDLENGPFQPFVMVKTLKTPSIDDFRDEELKILNLLVSDIQDAELRARVADIL